MTVKEIIFLKARAIGEMFMEGERSQRRRNLGFQSKGVIKEQRWFILDKSGSYLRTCTLFPRIQSLEPQIFTKFGQTFITVNLECFHHSKKKPWVH